ncbi:MAG TPA: C2H2-type zinc finger protein [Nitrososphaera sp.]
MGFLHRQKNECEVCHARFASYDELVQHAKETHKYRTVKCVYCGKQFLHEKDRLHHAREENEKKVDARRHKF